MSRTKYSVADSKGKTSQSNVRFRADAKQTAALVSAAKTGTSKAIRASKALGLPITYLENGIIYEEKADGSRISLKKVNNVSQAPLKLTRGTIFHAKK